MTSSGRTAAAYRCQNCDRLFHPRYKSKRMYCSMACVWEASRARTEDRGRAESAAIVAGMTDEEITRFTDELPKFKLDEDEDDD